MALLSKSIQDLETERRELYQKGDRNDAAALYLDRLLYEKQLESINSVAGASYQQLLVNARSEYMATNPDASFTDFNKEYGYNREGLITAITGIAAGVSAGKALANEEAALIAKEKATASKEIEAGKTLTTEDFPGVSSKITQKQMRHLEGRAELARRGDVGYMQNLSDAQAVLDAFHNGTAEIIGKTNKGFPIVRVKDITGIHVNKGAGISNQQTNVFIIKGTSSPSVVPMNPMKGNQ